MPSVADLLRQDKPLSTGATAIYPYNAMLERKYKFMSRYGDEVWLCQKDGDVLHLPRALCPVAILDERVKGQKVVFPHGPEPRDNQIKIFEETEAFLQKGLSGLVSAYTGWGKTVLGYHAAFVVQRKTLVITTKDDIYKQWLAGAPKMLGIDPSEVGEIRGDKCEVTGTKFVVAMIHSLSKDNKYPDWITKDFGLIIFDECHRVPADQFQSVAMMFPALLRLGLSATIERSDGKELLVYSHIGPVRAKTEEETLVPKVIRMQTAWECPRVIRSDKVTGEKKYIRMPHEPGKTTHVEKIIAADPVRNHQIADAIKMVYDKGRKVVVFSTLIDHLQSMQRACIALGIPGKDMGYYIGVHNKAEREARDKVVVRPILFTTFAMMSEGTNIPWLDACVITMPRSNVTQPVGRIRREYEDKMAPVVIDFVDNDSPVFAGYASSRLAWYQSLGCKIVNL